MIEHILLITDQLLKSYLQLIHFKKTISSKHYLFRLNKNT